MGDLDAKYETYVEAIPHGNGKFITPGVYIMWPNGSVTIVQNHKGDVFTFTATPPHAIFFQAFFARAIEARTEKHESSLAGGDKEEK